MAWPNRLFIVLSGPPASGKSTIAPLIAAGIGLPLLAKDIIKDALMSTLTVPDIETSRQLGRAAVAIMFALAPHAPAGAVLESNFYRSASVDQVRQLPGVVIEVFCRCDRPVAEERYRRRTGTRDAGHFDGLRAAEELWNEEVSQPVDGGWPLLEVDTNNRVDIAAVMGDLSRLLQ